MDQIIVAHTFGNALAKALNDAKVEPAGTSKDYCAVMFITGRMGTAPIAGSLNYDRDAKVWSANLQLEMAERI